MDYHDPYIPVMPQTRRHNFDMRSVPLTPENLASYDVVLIATDHSCLDYEFILIMPHWWWILVTPSPEKIITIR